MKMGHKAISIDLLKKAYERIVDVNIYCVGIANLLEDKDEKDKFARIILRHTEVIGDLEEFVKSKEGE